MYESLYMRDHLKEAKEEKAIEDAVILVKEFNISPELAAQKLEAPLDKVLEVLEAK